MRSSASPTSRRSITPWRNCRRSTGRWSSCTTSLGVPLPEAATALGISLGAAKSRLHRAMARDARGVDRLRLWRSRPEESAHDRLPRLDRRSSASSTSWLPPSTPTTSRTSCTGGARPAAPVVDVPREVDSHGRRRSPAGAGSRIPWRIAGLVILAARRVGDPRRRRPAPCAPPLVSRERRGRLCGATGRSTAVTSRPAARRWSPARGCAPHFSPDDEVAYLQVADGAADRLLVAERMAATRARSSGPPTSAWWDWAPGGDRLGVLTCRRQVPRPCPSWMRPGRPRRAHSPS